MTQSAFTCVLDIKARLGECPVWSVADQMLTFVDIKGRMVHRFDPANDAHTSMATPEDVGCIALAPQFGGYAAAMRTGVYQLGLDGTVGGKLANNPEDHAVSRFNDGRCDRKGRLWVGTIDEPKAVANAHLYRLDDRGLADMGGSLLTSNGLAFSPDDAWLYHSDTPNFVVYRYPFDLETGELGPRQDFIRLTPTDTDRGRPDGAAVDAEGCYWTALYEGARVQRYDPSGRLMAEYPVPAKCPTMVAFGGLDLKTLFVTSAHDGRPADEFEQFPLAGGLFAMTVDTPGQPEPTFAGV